MNDTMMAIIERGEGMARKHRVGFNRLTSMIDMEKANKQYPLDLERMLNADDINFAHDFFGIRKHMDRKTGKLGDCFVPRFAKPLT